MDSNFDLRDAPFLKRIRQVGIRQAVFEGVNDVVWRLTAGLDIAELRAVLRGDPPTARPNPRLKPHADGFWFHIRPGYYNEDVVALYPTFKLGFLSVYLFVVEFVTGVFLMVFYTPSTAQAYDNMLDILSNVPLGQFMRDLHRLGAEAMVIVVALHMLRTFWTASYKKPRQFTWATGVLLLFFTLGLSYTGYLLPWDQLAYWAVTIGASMAEAFPPPIVGERINILLKGAPDLGQGGLLRFYLLHVIGFPTLLIIFLSVHYYKVILYAHSLPPEKERTGEDTAKRIPVDKRVYFTPDVLTSELLITGVVTVILVAAVLFFYHAPLETWANPQSTPLHTIAPWYFLWIQGLLKLGDKTIMGVIVPGALITAFILMPYIDVGPFRRYHQRRFAISLSLLFILFIVVTSWMGTPAFAVRTSLDQEIFFELAPPEQVGLVRAIPYEELALGEYEIDTFEENESLGRSTALYRVLEEYRDMIEEARLTSPDEGGLPDAEAFLIVSQLQPKLKGITLRITWTGPDGNRLTNEMLVPVHEEAYPGGGE